jgi:ABC-type polysaccharide/polyol phosphate export permease
MQSINVARYYFSGMKRNPYRLFGIFFVPIIDIILYYYLVISIDENVGSNSLLFAFISSIIFWSFFSKITSSISGEFIDDATSKSIRSIIISPVSERDLILGLFFSAIIKVIIIAFISFSILQLFLGSILLSFNWMAWFLILVLFGWSVGILIAGAVFVFGERVGVLGMYVNLLVQPLSCVFYRRDVLPEPLKMLSYLFPSSYVFESIRSNLEGDKSKDLLLPLFLSIAFLLISFFLFGYFLNYSKRNGMITKI